MTPARFVDDRGTEARALIAANAQTLAVLEAEAEAWLASGDGDRALRTVQVAANVAWMAHPGTYVSTRLERVVAEVARTLPDWSGEPRHREGPGWPAHVLHVLSEAYPIGGHTRMASRWIEADRARRHSVVLTRQRNLRVPDHLQRAVASAGGSLHRTDDGSLLDRAAQIRTLAAGHDLVVLHIHPYDAVALAGLADRAATGPPVLLVNHADHVFWLGAGFADLVIHLRDSGAEVSRTRRGIEPARHTYLSSPLPLPLRQHTRGDAKHALGIDPAAPVFVTVASSHKFAPMDDVSFLALVEPVIARHPTATLLAVGAPATGAWEAAAARTGGRIRALGHQADPTPYFEAGDVYLDSYPLVSVTSLLEGALYGMPVVTYRPEELGPLASDDRGIGAGLLSADSVPDYHALLRSLLADDVVRARLGGAAHAGVADLHTGDGWKGHLARLYSGAMVATPVDPGAGVSLPAATAPVEAFDLRLCLHQVASGLVPSLAAVTRDHGLVADDPDRPPEREGLSVVVLAANGWGATMRCLQSVVDTCSAVGPLDVVVVDNGSTDETEAALGYLAEDLRSVRFPAPVPADDAWAAGVAPATGEVVVLVSDDILLTPGWLEAVLGAFATDPAVEAVTPAVLDEAAGTRGPSGAPATGTGVCFAVRAEALARGTFGVRFEGGVAVQRPAAVSA